ncbi:hypothetical protein RCG17_15725 [Neobacillus sp. PS3-12]|uniref:hypothetical protein n=1 Tax=Neobacillus sp. PS3-12 TaxID=3070677 RepID=UPI0027E1F445|nr:hypothetical protein [Neobacillus sp. PS3-12]WML50957.1 hypothetical protein RCG17_15725 [Neobacillus sp. PS3-12]
MRVNKVLIRDIEVPIKDGIVRRLNFGDKMSVEVELNVHPTVVNFVNVSGFFKERVRILTENEAEITGKFTILTGTSGILLTSDNNDVDVSDEFNLIPSYSSTFFPNSDRECSLNNELKSKQISVFITFLTSLLESEIKDSGNHEFIFAVAEKLKQGQSLNNFDQYIMKEIRYFLEDTINDSRCFCKVTK